MIPDVVRAHIRAHCVDPYDHAQHFDGIKFYSVVLFNAIFVNKPACVRKLLHRFGRGVPCRVGRGIRFDLDCVGDTESRRRLGEFVFRRARPSGPAAGTVVFRGRGPTRIADERNVRLFEVNKAGPERRVEDFARFAVSFVAFAAMFVERRLNVTFVAHGNIVPRRRLNRRRFAQRGDRTRLRTRRRHLRFVTAGTAAALAGHDAGKRTHRLQALVILVEQLEVKRDSGRGVERHAAVFFNGHGSENAFDAFRLHHGDGGPGRDIRPVVPKGIGFRLDVQNAQVFRLAAQFFRGAVVDVVAVDNAGRRVGALFPSRPFNAVDDRGRDGPLANRLRVKHVMDAFANELAVAVDVHEQKDVLPVALRRDEKIAFRERIGRIVGRVFARRTVIGRLDRIDGTVAAFGPYDVGGYFCESVGEVESLGRIDDTDRTGKPVMVRASGEHDAGTVRNLPRVFREVGPDRLIAPKDLRLRSVRIHSPETDAAPERLVRVFPTAEKNAAVREDRGKIVGLVIARNDVKVRRIELHAREDKRVSRRHAADVGVAARR